MYTDKHMIVRAAVTKITEISVRCLKIHSLLVLTGTFHLHTSAGVLGAANQEKLDTNLIVPFQK